MIKGGPLLNCPKCGKLNHCVSIRLYKAGENNDRNLHFVNHNDICWYRRARKCEGCDEIFLTAEIAEKFLEELVDLRSKLNEAGIDDQQFDNFINQEREKLSKKNDIITNIKVANTWIESPLFVSEELCKSFVRSSAWWLTHSSGSPVRAAGYANRAYKNSRHGWAVDFGANTFCIAKAIQRCGSLIKCELRAKFAS
jgi:hypothetical protein